MGRVCIGQAGYGPSLSWAKFGKGRDVQLCTSHLYPQPPTYGDSRDIAGLMCRAITF